MYGKVSQTIPTIKFVEKGDFFGNTRLWGRHTLYNTHELYLGSKQSSGSPIMGSIEDRPPTLYSISNG